MADDDADEYEVSNIRETLIRKLIGSRLVDVTQQDADEYKERGAFIVLMFEGGGTITFPVGEDEGFEVEI